MTLLGFLGLGGAGAAAAPALGAASSGFSLAGLLQGVTTVLGVVSSISAGNAAAEEKELAAQDAEREKDLEALQGIDRRLSIRRQLSDAVGAQDVAYAASGVDLSFGTAGKARSEAAREADYLLTSDVSTEEVRRSRLTERAVNARSQAKRARLGGFLNAASGAASGLASIAGRY